MGRISVIVQSDGLVAEIQAGAGPSVTAAELRAELASARVVCGLDEQAIEELARRLADPEFKTKQIVARAMAPVPGTDGSLVCTFAEAPLAGTVQPNGSIDYHERELLHPVAPGQEIARIVAPTAGTPGRSVRGEPLASEAGRAFAPRLGPGAQAHGDRVTAARGGVLLRTACQLDVVPLYTHPADVDLVSGNLHTHGSLLIRGDVRQACAAEADGDVMITGAVLDARVTAGGSVQVQQGILGASSEVQAGEDITCRHATSAQLRAGRVIDLGDEATHCRMQADRIRVLSGRGVAFGGELRARQAIELRVAGSANGAATKLSVCDLNDERAELVRREADAMRLSRASKRFPPTDAKAPRSATRASDHSRQERLRVLQLQRELLRTAVIRIEHAVHPGVVLQFGQVALPITETLASATFHFDTERDVIVQSPLP